MAYLSSGPAKHDMSVQKRRPLLETMAGRGQNRKAITDLYNRSRAQSQTGRMYGANNGVGMLGDSYFQSQQGMTPGYGRNTQPVDARYALGGQPAMPAPAFGTGVGPGPVADPQGLQGFLRRNAPEAFSSVMQGGERAESGVYNMPNAKVGPTGNVSTGPGETMFYDAGRGVARIVGKERTGYDGNGDRAILPRNETQQRMHEEGIQDGANRRLARLQSILQSGGGSMEGIDPIGANGQFTSGQLMRQLQRGPNQRGPVNQILASAGRSSEQPGSQFNEMVSGMRANAPEGADITGGVIEAAYTDPSLRDSPEKAWRALATQGVTREELLEIAESGGPIGEWVDSILRGIGLSRGDGQAPAENYQRRLDTKRTEMNSGPGWAYTHPTF